MWYGSLSVGEDVNLMEIEEFKNERVSFGSLVIRKRNLGNQHHVDKIEERGGMMKGFEAFQNQSLWS